MEESREKMAEILAVDVVILPPVEISQSAIDLNISIENASFNLSTRDYLPHITLAMAYINDLSGILGAVEQVAKKSRQFVVTTGNISYGEMDSLWNGGKYGSHWNIEKNADLLNLHQLLVQNIKDVDLPPNANQSFVGPEQVSPAAAEYVGDFKANSSGENYWPHITLGVGESGLEQSLRKEFVCDEIILAQLGNFCTVRKILWRFKLG